MVGLDTKLSVVIGPRSATAFQKAWGLVTVADLLSQYPRRYAHRGEPTALDSLPDGEVATVIATVLRVTSKAFKTRRGTIQTVTIGDGRSEMTATFFNQPWRENQLSKGDRGMFSGKVTRFRGEAQLTHPEIKLFSEDEDMPDPEVDVERARQWAIQPIPVYPATASIQSWKVAEAIAHTLEVIDDDEVLDPLPEGARAEHGLLGYVEALRLIHTPQTDADWRRARDTLRFHEAFVLQTALLQQRAVSRSAHTLPRTAVPGGYAERLDEALPFELTPDQGLVGAELAFDLARDIPMNRLVQGEVGSGKTLVAVRAMATVADSGGQSALLAPTEVLAAQHLRSIVRALGPDLSAELMPTLLTGQLTTAERKKALLRIVTGQARIVVGTHALLSDAVEFFDLGLVVVDEQHRFGVEQRETLRAKGKTPPHLLVLTATPIPRTVAMTVFGDLDISTIHQLPQGRQGIESFVVPLAEKPDWFNNIWKRARQEVDQGRQVFVVCPAISPKDLEEGDRFESDDAEEEAAAPKHPLANVVDVHAALTQRPDLAGVRIGMLHGRMTSDEKDEVMGAFGRRELDLIVATTVIEVGVDVPNASAMIVLDADRFGVSQLHQLRGRVGRGSVPGVCLFVTYAELETLARDRVEAVAANHDGFELAQIDLELRREGDVLGARQSGGRSSLRLLRVALDGEVIAQARAAAASVIEADPTLRAHAPLKEAVERRLDESEKQFLSKG
ncbi:ATP-dependent DNA helicase RecG [Gryllotalpicola protaetiae]|uniref:Probable DNA 3'-5' helicase RecG n=1 Tax=Gryllotalpicola protaetiae TaxID=2419771 RepID=A0A387BIW7_9MICO|nr:ATP-dependent DNA helicase RecG [Gryllotalpicola protaetiae]AYG02162.1 ATP-dependent DNA helicase RecG [Gryllotalpicola protaetiae]